MREIDKIEAKNINGGHKGFLYEAGVVWMDTTLAMWGFFASVAVGIDQEVK